jgi:hypothetical protein
LLKITRKLGTAVGSVRKIVGGLVIRQAGADALAGKDHL